MNYGTENHLLSLFPLETRFPFFSNFFSSLASRPFRTVTNAPISARSSLPVSLCLLHAARPSLSHCRSFKIRRKTFLNYIKFADLLIWSLWNCERVDGVFRFLLNESIEISSGSSKVKLSSIQPLDYVNRDRFKRAFHEPIIYVLCIINLSL